MNRHSVSCPAPTPAWVSLVHSASVWASCLAWAPWASCAPRLSLTIVGPLVWHQEHCMHPTTVSHLGRKGAWIQLFKRRWCGKSGHSLYYLVLCWRLSPDIRNQKSSCSPNILQPLSKLIPHRVCCCGQWWSRLGQPYLTLFSQSYVEICTLPTLKTVLISPISWG